MNYLLDTCVISELISRQPNSQVLDWLRNLPSERIFLSVLTIGEIQRGIKKLPDSNRKQELAEWLKAELLERFQNRILAIDTEIMLCWGELITDLEKQGRILPAIDSLLAAQVLTLGLQFVTRNDKDFAGTGIQIINPWQI
ncbi:MAG: type II toxin-antitoxin system VapC family toxin [Ardenticatenaceae bacterium]|nr:type II toxin-antitoxin system VapC family toxin [Anaerolineales bacterium]MCB8977354.1 type II toxin-antitoxin system VapC family toxin [Ardenticatenaceae bacterium]